MVSGTVVVDVIINVFGGRVAHPQNVLFCFVPFVPAFFHCSICIKLLRCILGTVSSLNDDDGHCLTCAVQVHFYFYQRNIGSIQSNHRSQI